VDSENLASLMDTLSSQSCGHSSNWDVAEVKESRQLKLPVHEPCDPDKTSAPQRPVHGQAIET
jgi:hypothetical protein